MIYLDNAATTKPDPRVLKAMMPYLTDEFGNAGSTHTLGRNANKAITTAREQVAKLFHCCPDQVLFTSGGTEANNMVFNGVADHLKEIGKTHILISAVEHDSILNFSRELIKRDFYIQILPVDPQGIVSVETVQHNIQEDTGLVSVMYVNNEVGTVNPIEKIGELCNSRGILFHTDCVQAAGTHDLNVGRIGCDFASVSSHKIHGVKGVGALFVRDREIFKPTIIGGSTQEFGLRGGTENVPGIVAFGKACEICCEETQQDLIHISTLKQTFYSELINHIEKDSIKVNGSSALTPGKILNLQIKGVDAETILLLADSKGVHISAGSACTSHELTPSHVLTAMGLSNDEAHNSIRISFSKDNTEEEVINAAKIVADCINCARGWLF